MLDLDGTLMDSEAIHRREELRLLTDSGFAFSDAELRQYQGWSLTGMLQDFELRRGWNIDPIEFAAELDRRLAPKLAAEAMFYPDAHAALIRWQALGVPLALVTSSRRLLVEALRATNPILHAFVVTVTVDDVAVPKPAPEAYLRAAQGLGIHPGHALVVEDSGSGLQSGLASGASVIRIARPEHGDDLSPEVAGRIALTVTSLLDPAIDELRLTAPSR